MEVRYIIKNDFILKIKNIYFFFKKKIKNFPLRRFLFLIIILFIYRIGNFIPIPGIRINFFKIKRNIYRNNFISIINIFSGIKLSNFSMFSLGIMPYISSSILIQLLSLISPYIKSLKLEGELGNSKILKLTKYFTILFSFLQSLIVLLSLILKKNKILHLDFIFYITLIVTFTTSAVIIMWFSEQITKYGLGNGISIIIFVSIITGLSQIINNFFSLIFLKKNFFLIVLIFIILVFIIVFFEKGQRKIYISYINKQINNKIYFNKSIYLPLKLNISGVIPVIFSSSIISLPSILINWFLFKKNIFFFFFKKISFFLIPGKLLYIILHICLIIFFCFFYSSIIFNSYEIAENLKKNDALIIGLRPGNYTFNFINKILLQLTFLGSLYISLIYLLPQFLIYYFKFSFYFSGTSLLIIVLVAMDILEQIQCFIIDKENNSLFKNIKI
ncbi:preprotein translocase subunit SecY [Candidatus Zinderia endosymbiont of Aphrophora alni]|uniref:preprotein translocase subunit SecY n=1 Tax=Candidatus Zinderia endosymbiont of Aphrophora alni TaxID=3077951 RepID=UPI0030CF4F8D